MFHILSKMEKRVLPDMLKAREQKQCLNYQRKNAKKIRELKKDIKNFRNVFSETQSRYKQQLLNLLQHHPKIQLACKEMEPLQVIDHMKQLVFTQRKELDHLKYMKKQELKKLKQLQLQAAELNDSDKLLGLNLHKPRYTEQTLTNKIENVGMRYNAAAKINKIYRNITEILKQDSLYFDTVLRTLEVKSVVQSCALIKQTRIGQETTEDLANIKEEYEILEHEVKGNMCQRDLAVQSLRGEVHHLYRECLGLVRVKSDRDIQKQRPTESELDLPKDLERLEDILSEIEAVTHGSTYDDIFPRIKDQLHQKNHLESQLQLNVTSRDNLLRKRNHAQMMITMLGTTMAETTAYHEEEEARILGEIEFQEKREGTMEVTIKERRDLLAAIRNSLQVIYEMVSRVNTESEDKVADLEQLLIVKPSTLPVPSSPMLDDAQEMINLITEKMEHIMSCLPEELDEEAIQNAATIMNEKQAAKATSRIKFSATPIYETLLEDLDDIEDPNVPTRADIKKTDQMDMQLGSANTKSGNPNNQGKRI